MSEVNPKRVYESSRKQKQRINRAIDWFMAKKVQKDGETDEVFPLKYKKLCVFAEAKYDTLVHNSHPDEIDTYAGAKYIFGEGVVEVKPTTWLRNRGKLDDLDEIGGGSKEDYIKNGDE